MPNKLPNFLPMWLVIQKGSVFLDQLLTAFKIPVSALSIDKPAAQTGIGKKSHQHAHQTSGGSKFFSTTQGKS